MIDVSRRTFLRRAGQGIAAAIACQVDGRVGAGSREWPWGNEDGAGQFVYVGCLTSRDRQARGEGLSVYRVNPATGAWTLVQVVAGELNPSFLAMDPRRPCLYVSHSDGGMVSAFRIDAPTGTLTLLNRQSTGGQNPAHVALSPSGRFVLAANYGGGTVAVLPVDADGRLGARTDLVEMQGVPGPRRPQQSASHPHQCRFDAVGRVVAVPDLGLDRVHLFTLDEALGTLRALAPPPVDVRPGAGPRHVDFHPSEPCMFVANELDSTVAVYRETAPGAWTRRQVISTVPAAFTDSNTAAEVEVSRSGRFLFVSNRGHDSIATFRIDARSGMLAEGRWTATRGKTPRFFCQDAAGGRLLVANQSTDTIVTFRVDERSGALSPTGTPVDVLTPTAIAFGR